jgi:hypothetical protein
LAPIADIEQRNKNGLGPAALGSERGIREGEHQGGASATSMRMVVRSVPRQRRRGEGYRRLFGGDPRSNHLTAGSSDEQQRRHHEDDGSHVTPVRQTALPNAANQPLSMLFHASLPGGGWIRRDNSPGTIRRSLHEWLAGNYSLSACAPASNFARVWPAGNARIRPRRQMTSK